MSIPSSIPATEAQPPNGCSIVAGIVNRLLLPVLALVLVLWNSLYFLNNLCLMPKNDFGRIHYSTLNYVNGRDMYGWTKAIPARIEPDYALDLHNMNPPHLHLLFLPFTLLADDHALVVWWVLSGLCFFHCLRWICAETGVVLNPEQRRWATLLLLGFSGTAAMLATSQLSFVLLVPVTLMWLAARRGLWGWSGFFLGLALAAKPFLGVFVAYLAWRRQWRATAVCLITVALCFAIGLAVFGLDNHLSWRQRLADSEGWAWLPMNASLTALLTRTFAYSVWYVPLAELPVPVIWSIWLGIGSLIGLGTLLLTSRGNTPEDVDRNFALLMIVSILLCPLGWIYYLWLALPAFAGLWSRGWPKPQGESSSLGGSAEQTRRRWTRRLLSVTVIAFVWPIIGTRLFQPDSYYLRWPQVDPPDRNPLIETLATIFIGNIYFWGLLALWLSLIWDAWARRRQPVVSSVPELAPLPPAAYRVSVVMPVFSETDTVRSITAWLIEHLGAQLEEIIIVQSPRSAEASRAVCRQLASEFSQVRLQTQQNNPGLGHAVREGYASVRGNLVFNIDSDGEMEIETVPRMLAAMAAGNHALVVASRWLPGGGFAGYSRLKYHLNWCFQQLFRWLFWTRLHDLTYGFKLMRAELARGIRWEGTLHEIACETTLKCVRLGVSTAEVPSKWTARTQGASKNTFWRNFRYVRTAVRILVNGVPFANSQEEPRRLADSPSGLPEGAPSGVDLIFGGSITTPELGRAEPLTRYC